MQTLRVARWDGSKWSNLGTVTTTGNTTAGTVQTNANQNAFGDFIIAKRSPSLSASAGADRFLCEGLTTTLGGDPSGTGGISPFVYSWSPSTDLNSNSVGNPQASPNTTRTYTLTVTDLDHTIATDNVVITVASFPLPEADAGPDYTVCQGIGIILGAAPVATQGTPPYVTEWRDGTGAVISNLENPSVLTLSSFYSVIVTDSNNCFVKDTMEIVLTETPQAHAGNDTSVCYLSPVTLGAVNSATGGDAPYTYSWYPLYEISDPLASNPTVELTETESYILHVVDSNGCPGIDDTIEVEIKDRPNFFMGGPNYICNFGDTTTLGTDTMIQDGYPPYDFYWYPNYSISDTQAQNPLVYPEHDTVYYLIVTDSIGCTYYVPEEVKKSLLVARAGFDQSIMTGCAVTLGGSPSAYGGVEPHTYLWNTIASNDSLSSNPVDTPLVTTEYSLVVTDAIGCNSYDTVVINVLPHADSSHLAIVLNTPDTVMQYYKLITMDTITWFRFQSDSSHVLIICQRYDRLDFTFSELTLYSDTTLTGIPIATAYLSNVNHRRNRGIANAVLTEGNTYYLQLKKSGLTQESIILLYSAVRPNPPQADILEDY